MRTLWRSLLVVTVLLIAGTAWAQEPQPGGWLGAQVQDVTQEEADKLGWEAPRGAKIIDLTAGAPAAVAGLQRSDVIVTLDGADVENRAGLIAALTAKGAGVPVKLRLLRAGKEKTVTVTLGAPSPGRVSTAGMAPQLMLDTGGHTAHIVSVATTPDGKQLVSASTDKTVRVWDIDTGKTVRVIRGETALGDWGVIYAMALSPDGRWLAIGGVLHDTDPAIRAAIRLYDFASGKLETLMKGHSGAVLALAFSPDGKRLVSGSGDKTAIIWDLSTRESLLSLSGHGKAVKAVAFSKDGRRIVTGSEDETLRLWGAQDGNLIAEMIQHKQMAAADAERVAKQLGREPVQRNADVTAVAFSPTDEVIASASADGRIMVWNGRTGIFMRQFVHIGGFVGFSTISSVQFSPDGRWLLSASEYQGCQIFDAATVQEANSVVFQVGGELFDGKISPKWLTRTEVRRTRCNGGVAFTPDGRRIVASYASTLNVIDAQTSRAIKTLQGTGATVYGVGFARNGHAIAWGNTAERDSPLTHRIDLPLDGVGLGHPVDRNVPPRAGSQLAQGPGGYVRRTTAHGSWSIEFKRVSEGVLNLSRLEISKDFKVEVEVDLGDGGASNNNPLALTVDGQSALVGRGGLIRAYDLSGRALGAFIGHDGMVRDMTPSPDGRFLVSGAEDQTVRLWNAKTRELIVTLFRGTDGEWLMWTPQGYYTGSPGTDKIIGWQINKGPEQAPDHVGAEQLRQYLHRPDIVERAIILASAEQAVREAPGTGFKLADLLARPVPRFRIISPPTGSSLRGGRAAVTIAIDAIPDPIREIRVHVNGRQVQDLTPPADSGGFGAGERLLDVPLAKGSNEMRVTLINAIGETAETLTLTHDGEGDLDKRGTLHILAIGVNEYKGLGKSCGSSGNQSCDLRFSGADARKFAEAIEKRLGPSHNRIVSRVLVNGGDAKDAPTTGNIFDALELLRQTKETDTVALFIAGHGMNEGPDYRFLPTNAEWAGGALRGSTVLPWQILQGAVEAAKGRRLLFVDTCHSGNAYNQRLGNAAYYANIIAYTAARFDQAALEDPRIGHGLFTYAVVEGLAGQGDLDARRQISTKELAVYVVKRVGELAKSLNGEQEPQYFKGRDADDYVLARW